MLDEQVDGERHVGERRLAPRPPPDSPRPARPRRRGRGSPVPVTWLWKSGDQNSKTACSSPGPSRRCTRPGAPGSRTWTQSWRRGHRRSTPLRRTHRDDLTGSGSLRPADRREACDRRLAVWATRSGSTSGRPTPRSRWWPTTGRSSRRRLDRSRTSAAGGVAEQDADRDVGAGRRRGPRADRVAAPDAAADVRTIGVCSQYSSIVPVDAHGRADRAHDPLLGPPRYGRLVRGDGASPGGARGVHRAPRHPACGRRAVPRAHLVVPARSAGGARRHVRVPRARWTS